MRQFISGLTLAAALLTYAPAVQAQGAFEPVIYINSAAVTGYEIDQRLRFMQILRAPNADLETAQNELINDRLKLQAAKDMGIEPTEEALDAGLAEFAGRANMGTEEFVAALASAGVERQAFRDFIRAGVVWREIIRARFVPATQVSDAEVQQTLKRQIETPVVDRVLLSEIIIPAPPGREDAVRAQAQQVASSNPSEEAFAQAARRLSASGTARSGGRLDWVALSNLPPTLQPIIAALQPGQVTQPLSVEGAVILFLLRDTQGTLRAGAKQQVLDYAVLRLADQQAAATVKSRIDTCGDLQAQGKGATQRQTAAQGAIPTLIASQLASLDDNESTIISTGFGVEVIMLCSRQPALLAQQQPDVAVTTRAPDGVEAAIPGRGNAPEVSDLPSADVTRDQLFNQKVNALADAYLAELRANAVIRRP